MEGDTTIGVGLVGCGMIGQIHAAGLAQLVAEGETGIRAVAAADPSRDMLERVASNCSFARLGTDPAEVVDDPEVDAVVIGAPTAAHRELVPRVLDAGKHLYCEKPLAPTFDAARELCERVATVGVVAQVGFHSRFHPMICRLKAIVDSGELGAPMGFTLRDDQYFPAGDFVPGHSDWRSKKALAGGGALLEHSIHSADILAWIFGPPSWVFAATRNVLGYDVEDTAALTLEYESGVVGNLVTIFNGVTGREERRLEVFFERGVVELTTDFLVGAPEERFLVQRPASPAEEIAPGDLLAEHLEALGLAGRSFPFFQYLADRSFILSIRRGTCPGPGFPDALVAHATVEAAYRSAATGAPVAITAELLPS